MILQIDHLGNVGPSVEDFRKDIPYYRLTITCDYDNMRTYIARRDVPAGIELGDERYWKLLPTISQKFLYEYAQYKKSVAEQIDALDKRVTANEQNITTLINRFEEVFNFITGDDGNLTLNVNIPLSQQFGDNEKIGISQRTLTQAINHLMARINDIRGVGKEVMTLQVTPDYFISDSPREVTIYVSAGGSIFDELEVYADNKLIFKEEAVTDYKKTITITKTTVIKAVGTIMAEKQTVSKTIRQIYPFFIGSGTTYEDILEDKYVIPYNGSLVGHYPTEVEKENDRIFIIIANNYKNEILRIHMNGYDIPFDIITKDEYTIYSSKNKYIKGTYDIYIQ